MLFSSNVESNLTWNGLHPPLAAILVAAKHLQKPIVRVNIPSIYKFISWHARTAILFTWTDYKTIFLPITLFGCATAPVQSMWRLAHACLWIWLHLLLCNVSNQAASKSEDMVNRPWRPLPAGRVNDGQMKYLRKFMVVLCASWSLGMYGTSMMMVTAGLVLTSFAYDEMGLASHPVGKNFCNIWGYVSFETAAVKLMGPRMSLDDVSRAAVCWSGMLIFTTIQAQDFPDVDGDAAAGRMTLPIYAPEMSRLWTLVIIPLWSAWLSWYWSIGPASMAVITIFGAIVGVRFYKWRDSSSDKTSYVAFNIWLVAVSMLPLHFRFGVLPF